MISRHLKVRNCICKSVWLILNIPSVKEERLDIAVLCNLPLQQNFTGLQMIDIIISFTVTSDTSTFKLYFRVKITNTSKHFANGFVYFRSGDQLHILASPILLLIKINYVSKKGEWRLSTVMIWAAMSSAAVRPLCFLKSTVNAATYQDILEQFMLPSPDKLSGEADFYFPAGPATCPRSQRSQKLVQLPQHCCAWPWNYPDLNPIGNL